MADKTRGSELNTATIPADKRQIVATHCAESLLSLLSRNKIIIILNSQFWYMCLTVYMQKDIVSLTHPSTWSHMLYWSHKSFRRPNLSVCPAPGVPGGGQKIHKWSSTSLIIEDYDLFSYYLLLVLPALAINSKGSFPASTSSLISFSSSATSWRQDKRGISPFEYMYKLGLSALTH